MKSEQSKEARDVGDVGHPDRVRIARAEALGRRYRILDGRKRVWWLLQDASNGSLRKFPSGSRERLSDLLIASESAKGHGPHEVTDDISISLDGRSDRFHERADVFVGVDSLLPPADRVDANPKKSCSFLSADSARSLRIRRIRNHSMGE